CPLSSRNRECYSAPTQGPGGILPPASLVGNAPLASSRVINKRFSFVILGCLLLAASAAHSQPPFGRDAPAMPFIARQPQVRPGISLDQAIQRIRRETGGRILSADTIRN